MIRLAARWLLLLTIAAAGCSRPASYVSYTSQAKGFVISHPRGWQVSRSAEEERVWFLPPGAAQDPRGAPLTAAEFLTVFTLPADGPLSDDEVRRTGLSLLPIHGVSGFRRYREDGGIAWHRFEVTGASQQGEWASLGMVVVGPKGFHYVVCAKPLDRWREGQAPCTEMLNSFRPGRL